MTSEISIRNSRLFGELVAKSVAVSSIIEEREEISNELEVTTRQLDILLIEAKKDVSVSIWLRAGTSQHIHTNYNILESLGVDQDNELTLNGKKVYDGSKETPGGESGDSYFSIDENGDLVPKPKADGTPRGIWTNSFISAGGRNAEGGGGEGGLTQITIKFDDIPISEQGYTSENGEVVLPNYPTIEDFDLSVYLTKADAIDLYYSKNAGTQLETTVSGINTLLTDFKTLFDSMFAVEDGTIKAKMGLWSDSFISAGGKNTEEGGGGGITTFTIKIGDDEYSLENGVVTLPAYPTVPDVSGFILKTTADTLYQPKGDYLLGTTLYALSDAVGGDALNALKLGGEEPSHYATSQSVTDLSNTLTSFKNLFDSMFALDEDGYIQAKLGLWTNSFLSAGGQNTSGGGGGGGLTEFSIIINGTTYNSENGIALVSQQLQPLITDTNKLAYSLISGTPTFAAVATSGAYSDLSGTPNLGSLAYKNSLVASDIPDLSGTYLPLSGGTIGNRLIIESVADNKLVLNENGEDTKFQYIEFQNKGTRYGILGTFGDDNLKWNWYTLIHSGNIGSYALKKDGSNAMTSYITLNHDITQMLILKTSGGVNRGELGADTNTGELVWRNLQAGESWRYVAFTDSNVASATKLQTARSIWGQSFDGTGNVDGNITLTTGDQINGALGLAFNFLSGSAVDTTIWDGQANRIAVFKANGNVLIGSTNDNGYKLQVNGNVDINGYIRMQNNMPVYMKDTYGNELYQLWLTTGNTFFVGRGSVEYGYETVVCGNTIRFSAGSSPWNSHAVIDAYGNVLIGTTTDAGYKLDVAGNARITNYLTFDTLTYNASTFTNTSCGRIGSFDFPYSVTVQIGGSNTTATDKTHSFRVLNNTWTKCLFTVGNSGKVGINGIESPIAELEVNGNISATSNISINSTEWTEFSVSRSTAGVSSIGGIDGNGVYFAHTQDSVTTHMYLKAGKGLQVASNISASGAITAGTASDIRLKDNIQSISENRALEVLMSLNPITFTWNDKANELGKYQGLSQGFIAQEYEEIIPNSGRAIWEEYRAIDYNMAIPYIVKVEQNHEQRIRQVEQNHEQRIKQLEEELKTLKQQYYGI